MLLLNAQDGSRLVSGNYHEQKEPVVMEMASNPPCFWGHLLD